MHPTEVGAGEILANLSIGYIVLGAFVLTALRLILVPSRTVVARSVAELSESLILAGVLVFLIVRPFFLQAFFIPTESMETTLMGHDAGMSQTGVRYTDTIHDHIFVNKLSYRFHPPRFDDIIVFKATKAADFENNHTEENILIKRVIGVPGDTIEVKPDDAGVMRVWRNGKPLLHETYLHEPMQNPQPFEAIYAVREPLHLGPNQYFVMGDNRNYSSDSRFWGVVARDRIIGSASFIFWPPSRIRMLH